MNESAVKEDFVKTMFSLEDVARRWSICRTTVANLIKAGELESVHLGKRHMITIEQLTKFEHGLTETKRVKIT